MLYDCVLMEKKKWEKKTKQNKQKKKHKLLHPLEVFFNGFAYQKKADNRKFSKMPFFVSSGHI